MAARTTRSASEQIAAELRGRIESGELTPGDLLPSAREIARRWHVAIATATRVQAALRDAGLTETLPGVGVVVRRPRPTAHTLAARIPAGTSRTDIVVATAVAIADAEGMDAVTMRRLAIELGTAPMSLYSQIADKDDLELKMLDAVLAEWHAPARGDAGWRECLEAAARGLWELCRRHPWLAAALSLTRPPVLASGIAWTEFVLGSLADVVDELETRFDVHLSLFAYVRGTAISLESESVAMAATGLDADAWMDTQLPVLRAAADLSGYPQFSALIQQPYDFSLDRVFEQGLGWLLDGLAVRIDS